MQCRFDAEFKKFPFDGRDVGVLNFNKTILFTHEFLEEFLFMSCHNRVSHRGYIRSKIEVWQRSLFAEQESPDLESKRIKCSAFLSRPGLANIITDAIFDYIL